MGIPYPELGEPGEKEIVLTRVIVFLMVYRHVHSQQKIQICLVAAAAVVVVVAG